MFMVNMVVSTRSINSVLQIQGEFEDNFGIIFRFFLDNFLFLNENIYCDHSLEPSPRDSSNEGSQHTVDRGV